MLNEAGVHGGRPVLNVQKMPPVPFKGTAVLRVITDLAEQGYQVFPLTNEGLPTGKSQRVVLRVAVCVWAVDGMGELQRLAACRAEYGVLALVMVDGVTYEPTLGWFHRGTVRQ